MKAKTKRTNKTKKQAKGSENPRSLIFTARWEKPGAWPKEYDYPYKMAFVMPNGRTKTLCLRVIPFDGHFMDALDACYGLGKLHDKPKLVPDSEILLSAIPVPTR